MENYEHGTVCSSRRSNFFSIHIFDTKNEHVTFSIFDVICANKNSFARTEEKNRRMMAKRFQQKVIEDARKAGSPFPSGHRQRDLFFSQECLNLRSFFF